jgi:hypothetical protein
MHYGLEEMGIDRFGLSRRHPIILGIAVAGSLCGIGE